MHQSVTSRIAYAFDTRVTRQTTPALACTVGCFINEDWELIERVLDVKPLGDKGNEGVYGGMAFVRGARKCGGTDKIGCYTTIQDSI